MGRHCLSGARIVQVARSWIGTPYHHQASEKGAGTDCLGLVRGIWRELYGAEPLVPTVYTRDWAEASGRETLLDAAGAHLVPVAGDVRAGDVAIFRLRPGMVAKHAAIVSGEAVMIHAMEGGPVAEVALSPWWRRRIAGIFSFPGVQR